MNEETEKGHCHACKARHGWEHGPTLDLAKSEITKFKEKHGEKLK